MRRSNFALRVPPTLLAEARKTAESEGVALNHCNGGPPSPKFVAALSDSISIAERMLQAIPDPGLS